MAKFARASGILLHPTSLPGKYGIGDLGKWAYRFVDWLKENDQSLWQVLPLGPTGYADSPYQTISAFAGNTMLISLDKLVDEGWLNEDDLADCPVFPQDHVDFNPVIDYHERKLDLAYRGFLDNDDEQQKITFEEWCDDNAYWLDDFALFASIKDSQQKRAWVEWPQPLVAREDHAMAEAWARHADSIACRKFRQWVFHNQWYDLKAYANANGISIVGDIPIFMAHDSADVWANPDEYYLDEGGNPTVIAGVPPDYFSPTGQRWGNPLYRWDVMSAKGYSWWIARVRAMLSLVDIIRIDHFRGLDAYWEIPGDQPTAEHGQWVPGPGHEFLDAIKNALGGDLPIIAEDLGVITETVEKLRDDFDLPGMKLLQFAWSGPTNPFLPHNHTPNCVVYSGTHDNNTTIGWWEDEMDDDQREFFSTYLDLEVYDAAWRIMQLGMRSVANTFIMTMQDVLSLGSEARMNTPGTPSGNWQWRFLPEMLEGLKSDRLKHATRLYQRAPDQQEKFYGDAAQADK